MAKPVVLLVDDNEATCTLIKAVLASEFTVEVAGDGAQAIEKIKSRQYAAAIIDLLLPIVDGYAVLDYLRAERPDLLTRSLIVSAALTSKALDRLAAYETAGIISKPFDVETLREAVRRCAASDETPPRGPLLSGSVILLLASVLDKRWM